MPPQRAGVRDLGALRSPQINGDRPSGGARAGERRSGDAKGSARRCRPRKPATGELPTVLADGDNRQIDLVGRPRQQPTSRRPTAGPEQARDDPFQVAARDDRCARWSHGVRLAQMRHDVFCDSPAVQRGDVGGVDRMAEIADREHAGGRGRQRRVDDRCETAGVDLESGGASKLVIGNPVSGENDAVTGDVSP